MGFLHLQQVRLTSSAFSSFASLLHGTARWTPRDGGIHKAYLADEEPSYSSADYPQRTGSRKRESSSRSPRVVVEISSSLQVA